MHEILKNKKVIFFDVGYTLDRPASGDWMFTNAFLAVAGDRLKTYSEAQILAAKGKGLEYLAANHLIHDVNEECDRMARYYTIVSEELKLNLSPDEIHAVSRDRACNMNNYIAYADAIPVLQELSRTHILGVISDTWPSITPQLDTLHLREYFSFFTYSFELGVFKPDPKMYLDALSKCGYPAADTVFIDDSPVNLAGAAKMGITPILIAANPASDVDSPFTKIHSLMDLL